MQRVALQTELELPRKRVALLDQPEPIKAGEALEQRVAAQEITTAEADAIVKTMEINWAGFIGYTKWSEGNPPSCGYWQVKGSGLKEELAKAESSGNNYRTRILKGRMEREGAGEDDHHLLWFDATRSIWRSCPDGAVVGISGRAWRGLAGPWPGGYPYDLLTGLAIRRRAKLEAA